jgi:glucosamine-6-phosphate deaminase
MPAIEYTKDKIKVKVFETTDQMGQAAALFVAGTLSDTIAAKGSANLILATGASQFSFLEHLQNQDIEWQKITVFHLDEYAGMPETHPASFRKYLKERILEKVNPKQVHYIDGDAPDAEMETKRYENILRDHEIDIACIGIGENGHVAFNDPPVADFNDKRLVKIVELDQACRLQQLNEGWFNTIGEVPKFAMSLTIPAIMNSKVISCVVPDHRKSEAVYNTLNAEISEKCPATILRTHDNSVLFLDRASAEKILFRG